MVRNKLDRIPNSLSKAPKLLYIEADFSCIPNLSVYSRARSLKTLKILIESSVECQNSRPGDVFHPYIQSVDLSRSTNLSRLPDFIQAMPNLNELEIKGIGLEC